MNSVSVFVCFLIISDAVSLPSSRPGCSIDIQSELENPQALLLNINTEENGYDAFYLPTEGGEIHLSDGEVVLAACPGGTMNVFDNNTGFETSEVVCQSGQFQIQGKNVSFSQISCSCLPFHTARYSNVTCNGNHQEIEIGFLLKLNNRFIRLITLCYNKDYLFTYYSYFTMSKSIMWNEGGVPRPEFLQDSFYPFEVNTYYMRNTQRTTVNRQVGLSSNSTKYIAATNDYFLSRGHLAAKADFTYSSQMRATFHYVNAAPQWQVFNGRNWNRLETNIRSYVSDADTWDTRYTVYTGTHGVTTLPHEETGEDIPIYLYVDGDDKGIPVPKYYWRVLRNDNTGEAVAFVGINNPYHRDVSEDVICKSMCDQLEWVNWKDEIINQGYLYCCTVTDLRKIITNLPEFEVTGLLL